jgi:hypothetical protein
MAKNMRTLDLNKSDHLGPQIEPASLRIQKNDMNSLKIDKAPCTVDRNTYIDIG